jgi:hypothetical protein
MGKCKTTVMEKLNLDWKQTESTTETDLRMLLNENGKDKQAAEEDSEMRPSRSKKTFRCTVYLNDKKLRALPFTFFNSKRKIA